MEGVKSGSLNEALTRIIKDHLVSENAKSITHLYHFVLEQIEAPLLDAVMQKAKYNQSRAAKILGLSRGTLRTKLNIYFPGKYCETR